MFVGVRGIFSTSAAIRVTHERVFRFRLLPFTGL